MTTLVIPITPHLTASLVVLKIHSDHVSAQYSTDARRERNGFLRVLPSFWLSPTSTASRAYAGGAQAMGAPPRGGLQALGEGRKVPPAKSELALCLCLVPAIRSRALLAHPPATVPPACSLGLQTVGG